MLFIIRKKDIYYLLLEESIYINKELNNEYNIVS